MQNAQRTTNILTWVAAVIFLGFFTTYAIQGRTDLLIADIPISILGIWLFRRYFHKAHQDNISYGVFLGFLILHVAYIYPYSPLGIPWDHYMHFIGGFSLALIGDRLFRKEKWGKVQHALILIIFALGLGAIHEIWEWLGYAYLAEGEGFLFYGAGDFGEWQNLIFDFFFNLFGATCMALVAVWQRRKLK